MTDCCDTLRYPVGIQSFSEIREGGYVYVDKTTFIHKLIQEGKYYFLSRPRRFGKSLLLSTIQAYYEGRRDLFRGLALDSLTDKWEPHPVLHLDLNSSDYSCKEALTEIIENDFAQWEEKYNLTSGSCVSASIRFGNIIREIYAKTNKKVVILIDEYDKPMLQAISNEPLADKFRTTLKAIYGNLKSMDSYIELAIMTGVARFSKVSIFSDLNNLRDITFEDKFSAICGITNDEIDRYFPIGIQCLADKYHMTYEEAREQLRSRYDGYHFAEDMTDIYNPFSIINVFAANKLDTYWFQSGAPTFLVRLLEKKPIPIRNISGFEIGEHTLKSAGIMSNDPVVSLYQSGYLTIKAYDFESGLLTLDYPNREVKESFLKFLVPHYTAVQETETEFALSQFVKDVNMGRPEEFMQRLSSLIAKVPYGGKGTTPEDHFQNAIYLVFTLMGYRTHIEERMARGRIDMTVDVPGHVYIFEFKVNKSAKEAMEQIKANRYWSGLETSGKQIVLIAANFDSRSRQLTDDTIIERI